ncbi:MAG: DUF3718 domain-containing protein [Gammaproteobacteria bacterium]|nr:DUF3718 domain-containing protein [Gammaproteobacteria bacterium]
MKLAATLTVVLALSGYTFAPKANANLATALNGICENVAADNKSRFRKKIKESGVKLRDIYDGISCGGENLVRYAMTNNANDVGTYIVKRMPSSHFSASGDIEWASSKGLSASPIAESIATR